LSRHQIIGGSVTQYNFVVDYQGITQICHDKSFKCRCILSAGLDGLFPYPLIIKAALEIRRAVDNTPMGKHFAQVFQNG
jgi:hypothetical protein